MKLASVYFVNYVRMVVRSSPLPFLEAKDCAVLDLDELARIVWIRAKPESPMFGVPLENVSRFEPLAEPDVLPKPAAKAPPKPVAKPAPIKLVPGGKSESPSPDK